MTLVVDASVAIKWLLPEVLADHAARLLEGRERLAAPDFLLIEFGNVVWKKIRLGQVQPGDGEAALERLGSGPVALSRRVRFSDRRYGSPASWITRSTTASMWPRPRRWMAWP